MRKISKRIILGLVGVVGVTAACTVAYFYGEESGRSSAKSVAQYVEVSRDKNTRTISHPDGTRSVYVRTEDHRTLNKYNYAGNGELSQMTVYRMDENGKAMAAKIFDGRKEELFKVSYGYRKSDGVLAEERMFDSRTKRISPEDGKELPVWRYIHTWDENGKPTGRTEIKGQGASETEVAQHEITPFVNPFAN